MVLSICERNPLHSAYSNIQHAIRRVPSTDGEADVSPLGTWECPSSTSGPLERPYCPPYLPCVEHLPTRTEPFFIPGVRAVKTILCEFERVKDSEIQDGGGDMPVAGAHSACIHVASTRPTTHVRVSVQIPSRDAGNEPVRILFDPIFAQRAPLVAWFGHRRWFPPPCTAEDLPHVNSIVTSHNQYVGHFH